MGMMTGCMVGWVDVGGWMLGGGMKEQERKGQGVGVGRSSCSDNAPLPAAEHSRVRPPPLSYQTPPTPLSTPSPPTSSPTRCPQAPTPTHWMTPAAGRCTGCCRRRRRRPGCVRPTPSTTRRLPPASPSSRRRECLCVCVCIDKRERQGWREGERMWWARGFTRTTGRREDARMCVGGLQPVWRGF